MDHLRLAIVSADRATLDGVQDYFRSAGASLSSATRLDEVEAKTAGADAVIVFADDYARADVERAVHTFPAKVVVIVTADPRAFARSDGVSNERRLVVLARPAWGWTLIEAIRAGLALPEELAS